MTTTVKVFAHCSDDEMVRVTVRDGTEHLEELFLKSGEEAERYVYDDREITVREITVRKLEE